MTPRCLDPSIGDHLLADVRPGGAPLTPEQLQHLEVCESCRTSLERQRRLAMTWQDLEPTAREVRSARARFAVRGRERRSVKMVPKAAALVIVLAAAAASAAVRVVVVRLVSPQVPSPAVVVDPPTTPTQAKRPHGAAHHGKSPPMAAEIGDGLPEVADDVPAVADAGATAEPAVAEVSVNDLPPAPVQPPVPARRVSAAGPPAATLSAPAVQAAEAGAPPSWWTLAASAMRAGDYVGAEAAFNELARSPEASTRDAARLARAQVWIAQGRVSQARPELQSLTVDGATPLVRKRAADALDALH
jgi:hypothetical protein